MKEDDILNWFKMLLTYLLDRLPIPIIDHTMIFLYRTLDFLTIMSKDILPDLPGMAVLFIVGTLLTTGFISQFSLALQQQNTTSTSTTTAPISNFQTYSNSAFGIKMQYPSDWLKLNLSANTSSALIVVFKSPPGTLLGSLNIIAQNLSSQNITLSKLVDMNVNNLKQSGRIVNLVASTPSTLADNPAYKIVYTSISSRGIIFEAMQIFSLIGHKAYFITYVVPSTNYPSYLPTIQAIINSIKINR
jgi:PsbP-like protein